MTTMEAQVAAEAAEDRDEGMVTVVVETVRRVHEDARHPGLVQVCRVRSCEIWTDLLRDQGWRA